MWSSDDCVSIFGKNFIYIKDQFPAHVQLLSIHDEKLYIGINKLQPGTTVLRDNDVRLVGCQKGKDNSLLAN